MADSLSPTPAASQSPKTQTGVLVPEKATRLSSEEATLPTHNNEIGPAPRKGRLQIKHAGESGRAGFHPFHFFKIILRSSSRASKLCNIFFPVVPAAIAVNYARPDLHVVIFILAYIAMVPCANMIGFAGQELARKFSHVFGVLLETTFGSVVEIILFMVLLSQKQLQVIQAAILGSILATMLLCLGLCFFVGGLKRDEQTFNDAISEAGSGLLLTAGVALAVPAIYDRSLRGSEQVTGTRIDDDTLGISRGIAILLLVSYAVYIYFQARTHHGVYDAVFESDEIRDKDRHKELAKDKLTMTECVIALVVSITLVTVIAIALVEQIEFIKEQGVSDPFLGLILVPLVEKAAEHLTAVDEAWDDQMNLALSHVLGSTLQTALLNAPLVVIVGWGLGQRMSLNFEIFDVAVLILAIITVGNFLRDQKSNYLEGFLCVIVYVAIAVAAFYYPNPPPEHGGSEGGNGTTTGDPAAETTAAVIEHLLRLR